MELGRGRWVRLAGSVRLETLLGWLRHRGSMPHRLTREGEAGGRQGQELVALGAALVPLLLWVDHSQQIDPGALLRWQALPPMGPPHWAELAVLNWPSLVGNTIALTGLAAALAVGGAPLLLLLVAAWPLGKLVVRGIWLLARLWPPPLTALLLLFVLKPGMPTAALALGFHNLGILGRLLLECAETADRATEQALISGGTGPRMALLRYPISISEPRRLRRMSDAVLRWKKKTGK